MNLDDKFLELRRKKEAAFMPYVCCGDPTPEFTQELVKTLVRNGADIIELGIPFSDPIADGPTIQNASFRALKNGMNPDIALEMLSEFSKHIPVVVMTYYNVVHRRGAARFIKEITAAGAAGIIIPDLPYEESKPLVEITSMNGVPNIFLVTPRTSEERLRKILDAAKGFLYLVSVEGVTGARDVLSPAAVQLIQRVKRFSEIPAAVGFGISKPDHAEQAVQAGADGVIVGSKIIDIYAKQIENPFDALDEIADFASQMKRACVDAWRSKPEKLTVR